MRYAHLGGEEIVKISTIVPFFQEKVGENGKKIVSPRVEGLTRVIKIRYNNKELYSEEKYPKHNRRLYKWAKRNRSY